MFKLQDAYQCGSAGKTVKTRRQCTVTLSKLWWKPLPNVRVCRLIGIVTLSRLWLNITPKIKLYKLLGKVTRWVPVPCFAWPMFVPILSGSIPKFFKSSSSSVRKLFFARKKITCPDSMFIMFIIPVFPQIPPRHPQRWMSPFWRANALRAAQEVFKGQGLHLWFDMV